MYIKASHKNCSLVNKFSKIAGYKNLYTKSTSGKKTLIFLYTNKLSE